MERIYKALILKDYKGLPYAQWIKMEEKKLVKQSTGHLITAEILLFVAAKQIPLAVMQVRSLYCRIVEDKRYASR